MIRWLIAIIVVAAGSARGWYFCQTEIAGSAATLAAPPEIPPVIIRSDKATTATVYMYERAIGDG